MIPEREQVEQFLNDTLDARELSEKCRDYFDHKQWTDDQIAKLNRRGQAPIVVNRIKPKVEGLIGLYNLRNTDPKAFPRTEAHNEAAEAVTDALRYVADNNDFESVRLEVAEAFFVEGYGGALVDVKPNGKGEVEIRVEEIPWDRIYYDPHSRKKDFVDARFMGLILWLDADEAQEMFPDADIDSAVVGGTDETFEDRPRDSVGWTDNNRGRIRVALHFAIVKGEWTMSVFSGDVYFMEPQPSPFLDEFGLPSNPIELVSANVDRDNNRYGEVRGFLDQQDEINHRRSKALHTLSNRQTFGRKGAAEDVPKLKRELAKPDGHVEFPGDEWGKDFGMIPNGDMQRGQLELYQDAKSELDAVSFNAQLSGERQQGDLSGRAIDKLQQAGVIELNRQFSLLTNWEKRVYRQIWCRVKQFWNEEKWIRVTDSHDSLRWVGLNSQVTGQQMLEETIRNEALPPQQRQQAAQLLQFGLQTQDPALTTVQEVRNNVAELDMDILLDQSFDVINVEQEQLQMLMQYGANAEIDLLDLLELSQIRGKDELIERIEKRRQASAQAQQGAIQTAAMSEQAKLAKTAADADLSLARAQQVQVETQLAVAGREAIG